MTEEVKNPKRGAKFIQQGKMAAEISTLAEVPLKQVNRVINAMTYLIAEAAAQGNSVKVGNLGQFALRNVPRKNNTLNGITYTSEPTVTVKFNPSITLKRYVVSAHSGNPEQVDLDQEMQPD